MNKIESLRIKKLIKELDYIETDFELRTELVNEADTEFIMSINNFLEKNLKLKEIYDSKITENLERSIKNKIKDVKLERTKQEKVGEDDDNFFEERKDKIKEDENRINIHTKIKKLYREIVKKTHPDIVNDIKLNDIYIKATKYHESNDKLGIYKICNELGIQFEIDLEDSLFIEQKINEYKKRINFLESTFAWKWFNTEEESEKNNMILTFIKLKIS
jgi:uncharacterized protein (UPF0305 family)